MGSGLVLVIEDDEWVSRLLSVAIRDAGFEAEVCATAEAGLEAAIGREPECIVCDVDLPDHDGFWVAQNVRTHPSRASVSPFLFLSSLDDQESRLQGFHVGADVYMTKPFRVDEVVAQVTALVTMAERLRQRRDTFLSIPPEEGSAIEGDLSQMSIATVLTVLEMERRTGTFEVVSKKRRAYLDLAGGGIESGTIGGTKVDALTALRTMVGWNVGRFSFTPSHPRQPPSGQKSIGAILIEAMRLDDESKADMPLSRRTPDSDRLSAPSLGGPASDPSDMAPPSSRTTKPNESPRPGAVKPFAPPPPAVEEDIDDNWGALGADSEPEVRKAVPPAAPPKVQVPAVPRPPPRPGGPPRPGEPRKK